jgi:ADP-dependent NAD(P)H-hydrate dehydratase / NAD(P)H-hydrate epimerase
MAQPIYLSADIRRLEQMAGDATPSLMERAGSAAAALAARLANGKDILVLAGPGNNGGDARIVAERLREAYFRVTVATGADAATLAPDQRWALIVDGLFGIGLKREVSGEHAQLVRYANARHGPVLALDIPSGLDADTGRVLGTAVRATHTITFIALKPGLLTLDGPDHCGELTVAELDLDAQTLLKPNGWVADRALFASGLRPRPRNFHKGMAGSLAVLGGAAGMAGAALLAGRAALRLGAGRVYVGLLDHDAPAVDFAMPEMMLRHPDDALGEELDAVVAGPGIGQGERAETLVAAALASEMPCVLDADALNLMAQNRDLRAACARRAADTLLTPHPAEAARLLGVRTLEIQADRIGAARRISREFGAHVVLKGNGSVIAARDGHWFLNATGNPGMASAGMGDVLSGILGALLAQRYSGESSAVLGVHLHGAAADAQARSAGGAIGLTAGEIIEPARRILNAWLAG